MSQPPNALDQYRTYSYHHILVAADSTSTAESLSSEETVLTDFDHPDTKFCPQMAKNGGQYVVLINGMSDAQFVVQSAKWSTVPIPTVSSTTASKVTSVQTMAVDGEIEILEPQGVNFFNVLANVTKMMNVDPAIITFVLKTIFVGHRDDGNTTVISTIKPLLFMMVDITANIDVSGAVYSMALVGVANGAAKLPHVNSIVSGMTFNIPSTLGEAFSLLKTKIDGTYNAMYNVLTNSKNCGVKLDKDEFSEVEYVFDLDPEYVPYPAGDFKDEKFRNSTEEGGFVSNLGDMASIESIITGIMMSSSKVVSDAKESISPAKNTKRRMFKISSDIATDKTGKYTVTYHIHRYKAVVIPAEEFQTFEPEPGTGITFDYIFTGKNIDILDMDIKMEYGLMFFQVMAAEGTSPTSALELLNHHSPDTFVKGSGSPKVLNDDGKMTSPCTPNASKDKIKRPLFLGTSLNHPLFRDTASIGASADYNAMLTRHAAVEALGTKVTIRGNPQLLAETTQLPKDLTTSISNIEPEVVIPPDTESGLVDSLRAIMPKIHQTPAYVKIKVWSPKSWSTESADDAAGQFDDYAENLWYDGWYYMIQIDNVFSDGTFTQDLELVSLPTELTEQEHSEECVKEFEARLDEARREAGAGNKTDAVTPNTVPLASSPNVNKSTPVDMNADRKERTDNSKASESSRSVYTPDAETDAIGGA